MSLRIQERTPDLLVIRKRPWFLWLFGAVFAAVGAVSGITMTHVVTLHCERGSGECALAVDRLFWSNSEETFPVDHLMGAHVGVSESSDGNTYRVELVVDGEVIPFTSYYSSSRGPKQRNVWEVERFLRDREQPRLTLEEDGRWFGGIFGGIFFFVGLFVMTFGRFGTFRFSRAENSFEMRLTGIFGRRTRKLRLDEIDRVRVMSSQGESGTTYRAELVLTNGDAIPFTRYYSSGGGANWVQAEVSSFLRLRPSGEKIEPAAADLFPEREVPYVEDRTHEIFGEFESTTEW